MKIVITDSKTLTNGDIDLNIFAQFGELDCYEFTGEEETVSRIQDADIVLCNKTQLSEDILKQAKKLKYIGLFATGYNNIDLSYTKKAGITVCNAGEYSTSAVVQHTFAFILNWYNKIKAYDEYVKAGKWIGLDTFCPFEFQIAELQGKTIGIIGYGSIGKEVAKIAKAFSMNILVNTRTPIWDHVVTFTSREELLRRSDIITIHCPLNDDSYKMCDANFFKLCKRDAFFINTARGPIVDEAALLEALETGLIGGAAIDVLDQEPMAADCVLQKANNLTITPHVAWASIETRKRLIDIVISNLKGFINEKPINVVGN